MLTREGDESRHAAEAALRLQRVREIVLQRGEGVVLPVHRDVPGVRVVHAQFSRSASQTYMEIQTKTIKEQM